MAYISIHSILYSIVYNTFIIVNVEPFAFKTNKTLKTFIMFIIFVRKFWREKKYEI